MPQTAWFLGLILDLFNVLSLADGNIGESGPGMDPNG